MGSSSIHLVRKRCSLRRQPVLQLQGGSETGEHLGVSIRWGPGASKRKAQAPAHSAREEVRWWLKFCLCFPVLGCIHCTPHDPSQPTVHLSCTQRCMGVIRSLKSHRCLGEEALVGDDTFIGLLCSFRETEKTRLTRAGDHLSCKNYKC